MRSENATCDTHTQRPQVLWPWGKLLKMPDVHGNQCQESLFLKKIKNIGTDEWKYKIYWQHFSIELHLHNSTFLFEKSKYMHKLNLHFCKTTNVKKIIWCRDKIIKMYWGEKWGILYKYSPFQSTLY